MTKQIGKLLLTLIAALMVVDPVMACCLSSPLESAKAPQEVTDTLTVRPSKAPCHGVSDTASASSAATSNVVAESPPSTTTPCPDCGLTNCDAVMSAEPVKPLSLANLSIEEVVLAPANESATNSTLLRLTATLCVPHGPPPRAASTPISLRERLLI